MPESKNKVLFVGSFKETTKDGSVGGQMFACKAIISSSLSESIEWTLIDTTADSNILDGNYNRFQRALIRYIKFMYRIIFFKYDHILIFIGGGWSFWEKGIMSLNAKKLSKAKIILAPRSGHIINDINKNGRLSRFIKIVLNKVDVVICQSTFWEELFKKIAPTECNTEFIVIENIVEFDKYSGLPVRCLAKHEKVTILFLAWVTRNKGIFELIKAVKLLKAGGLKFNVIIGGKGDEYQTIKEEIESAGLSDCVVLKGWLLGSEKLNIISKSDIFVLPTYFEGYPNSLIEAMASGKVCIATNVSSIPDIIENKISGILIQPRNHIQLSEALEFLIKNPDVRYTLSVNARESIKKVNSSAKIINEYEKLFER